MLASAPAGIAHGDRYIKFLKTLTSIPKLSPTDRARRALKDLSSDMAGSLLSGYGHELTQASR